MDVEPVIGLDRMADSLALDELGHDTVETAVVS